MTNAPSRKPPIDTGSDEEIVARVLRGDTLLFEVLMRRHNQRIYRAIRSIVRDDSECEEIMQESYVRAFEHLAQFEGRAMFSTWLTRIVINAALMKRRSAKARPAVSLDETRHEEELPAAERFADDGPTPEQVYAGTEIREIINENLDELSPLLRTAFVLREVEGYSTGEAAKKLGVTENTLKARLWRARHQLAERLGRRLRRMKDGMTGTTVGDEACSYC